MTALSNGENTDIVVGYCLDETGSMGAILHPTIDGFNEYVSELRKQPGKTFLSLTMFSDVQASEPTYREFCRAKKIDKVKPLTVENYRPRGNTPLFDAIGHTIKKLESWLAASALESPAVLFVIQTDGHENASREFTRNMIVDLIRRKETEGWKFIYLGADQDAYEAERASAAMGMSVGTSFAYAGTTNVAAASAVGDATSFLRTNKGATSQAVADTVRASYNERTKDTDDEDSEASRPKATPKGTPNF